MEYTEALSKKHALEATVSQCDRALKSFPRGNMGLVPDAVKSTLEWKHANNQYNAAFKALREFNAYFTNAFKKEYAATRQAYRNQLNKA